MGTLATKLVLLRPRDPESKGIVERKNGWFEKSFMPGRSFASPADFNDQFTDWLAGANQKVVRTTKARPVDLLETDRAAMLALPPVPPIVGWRKQVRLGRDYYVNIARNDYSVDPTWIGRMVEAHADLDRVQVRLDGRLITEHPRVWARGLTITDTSHVETAKRLRQEFQQPRTQAADDGLVQGPGRLRQGLRPREPGGVLMATAKTTDVAKQLTYLAGALKAPRILDVASRLADQARDAGWTFEDYLAAVLEREVSARNASGAEMRMRAAGFGARKTLEDFDFDAQPAVRNQVAALASGGFLAEARNVVLLGPPGTGKTHLAIALGVDRLPPRPPGPVRHRHRLGHPALRRPPSREAGRRAGQAPPLRADHHRRSRLPTLRARRREPVLPARLQSRYEHASLVLTSNLPFSGWGGVFGDQVVAAAMIDRIVHHADVLTLKGSQLPAPQQGRDGGPGLRGSHPTCRRPASCTGEVMTTLTGRSQAGHVYGDRPLSHLPWPVHGEYRPLQRCASEGRAWHA